MGFVVFTKTLLIFMKKKLFKLGFLLVLLLSVTSCNDDAPTTSPATGSRFSFALEDANDLPEQMLSAKVSIETLDGEKIYTDHLIPLSSSHGSLTTEALKLPDGDYNITAFDVLYEDEELYGGINRSEAADALMLPFAFSVKGGENLFKLPWLKKKPFKGSFFLGAFASVDGQLKPVPATAYIKLGDTVLKTYELDAKFNKLPFNLDPKAAYTLEVVRKGFAPYQQQFIFSQLRSKFLKCILTPAFTMTGVANDYLDNLFEFIIDANPGTIHVNWGDGTTTSFTFTATEPSNIFTKNYPAPGTYPIVVTGDLDKIYMFYSFYDHGALAAVDLYALSELKEIRVGLTTAPPVIDLSANAKLEDVRLPGINALESVLLPASHNISYFDISGANSMTPAAVDQAIANIYSNAVSKMITGGYFGVQGSWWGDPDAPLFAGPPTATGMAQLTALRDAYGWSVTPEF
jgi:hypothetical protein